MSNCLCYCLPLSGNDTCSRFGGTPRRQDVRKTHRMTEVCLTDTYTGVQKLSLFLLCCVSSKPCPIWNNTLQHIHTHTCFHMPTLFSRLCSKHKQKGHEGHRQSSSMENSHGALRLGQSQYQFPDQNHRKPTQETVSHNRTRNVSSKKTESNQISAACYTPHPLYPQYVYFPHPRAM